MGRCRPARAPLGDTVPVSASRCELRCRRRMARSFSETTILQYVVENLPTLSSVHASSITCDWSRNPRENRFGRYLIVYACGDLTRKPDTASLIIKRTCRNLRAIRVVDRGRMGVGRRAASAGGRPGGGDVGRLNEIKRSMRRQARFDPLLARILDAGSGDREIAGSRRGRPCQPSATGPARRCSRSPGSPGASAGGSRPSRPTAAVTGRDIDPASFPRPSRARVPNPVGIDVGAVDLHPEGRPMVNRTQRSMSTRLRGRNRPPVAPGGSRTRARGRSGMPLTRGDVPSPEP